MSLRVMSWVLDESEAKLGARLVLLSLAEYAHDDGSKAFPSVENIARKARLSVRGARDALRKLEADGMIVKTGATKYGTNIYSVVGPFNEGRQIPPVGSPEQKGRQSNAPDVSKTAADSSVEPTTEQSSLREEIRQAWMAAPEMIQHRDSYFGDAKIVRLLDKAVTKYGVEDAVHAIKSYSTVLTSPEHFFNHRWTLGDFLSRGLDRFVPEAEPEKVFLRGGGMSSGASGHNEETVGYTKA